MKYLSFFILVFLVYSCVSVTPYQKRPSEKGLGYSDIRLDDDVYQIYFKGSSSTDMERVNDFALLRAAEVTLQNGCKYFSILEEKKYFKESINSYNTGILSSTEIIRKPGIILKIKCFKEKPDFFVFNAKNVLDNLSKKYKLKELKRKYKSGAKISTMNPLKEDSQAKAKRKRTKRRQANPPSPPGKEEEIFVVVEQPPAFPGCENIDNWERNRCNQEKLLKYIYANPKYPKEAKDAKGKVTARFVISKSGEVKRVKIIKDTGGCGEAVKKAILSLNENNIKWIPARQGGRKVEVFFTVPVNCKKLKLRHL